MTTSGNIPSQPYLPPNTIVPENEDLFLAFLNRMYEDIAFAVNSKDFNNYTMAITSTAQNILLVPTFGAFIICVSGAQTTFSAAGVESGLPTITASLCKAGTTAAGAIATLGSQVGTGDWGGFALTITSTASNFQIAHNRANVSGNFSIRLIGTQPWVGILNNE